MYLIPRVGSNRWGVVEAPERETRCVYERATIQGRINAVMSANDRSNIIILG